MKKYKLFASTLVLFLAVFITYSCNKDSEESTSNDMNIEELVLSEVTMEDVMGNLKKTNPNAIYSSIGNESVSVHVPCSTPAPVDVQLCSNSSVTDVMYLPAQPPSVGNRPACAEMTIHYNIRICLLADGTYDVNIWNFSAFPTDCPDFINWFLSLPFEDRGAAVDKWEYDASIIIETGTLNAFVANLGAVCPNFFATSTFSTDLCYARCYRPSSKFPGFVLSKNICGDQCCKRTRSACVDNDGNVFLTSHSFETIGEKCPEVDITEICGKFELPLSRECGVSCGPK